MRVSAVLIPTDRATMTPARMDLLVARGDGKGTSEWATPLVREDGVVVRAEGDDVRSVLFDVGVGVKVSDVRA